MTTPRKPRSGRGFSLVLAVDRNSAKPLHQQIYEAYREKILRRELRPGQAVLSSRDLARDLGTSRVPVLSAYTQLLAEGYFESRIGAGTFVSTSIPEPVPPRTDFGAVVRSTKGHPPVATAAASIPPHERPPWVYGRGAFNLSQPALDAFPFRIWSELLMRYARNMQVGALQYGEPMGLWELREAIAVYLRTARAVRCEPDQIMIVSGSQQALDVTTRTLLNPGSKVWVEEPGYWVIPRILKAAGCRPIPVPVDEEGLNVGAGIQLCKKATAAFVAPSHEFPLGVTMSVARRLQLLQWAERSSAWIIEDDYDSEYRYNAMPIASLQGLDRSERVIYIGTFSKVLFPSLRMGYLVIPQDLLKSFVAVRHSMDLCPAHVWQAILADFIKEGHFHRHLRRMRVLYSERRRALVDAIHHEFGSSLRIIGAEAGIHLTVELADGRDDRLIAERAARNKLWLWPLSPTYICGPARHGFILGFGNTTVEAIPAAVRLLKTILRD